MSEINRKLLVIGIAMLSIGLILGFGASKFFEDQIDTTIAQEEDVLPVGTCSVFSNVLSFADVVNDDGQDVLMVALENEQIWQVYPEDIEIARRNKHLLTEGSKIRVCDNGREDYIRMHKSNQELRAYRVDLDIID